MYKFLLMLVFQLKVRSYGICPSPSGLFHLPPEEKSKQNITRDIEVKNNLTIARGEWGGDSGERGLQELL